ncbi:hypothetical protein AVEN_107737-1 [Araneus ventricosus]|uniref:Uncharacterized protein n=1 Tax=Araneus ventricosus TaxID=182803 RepID=A0A4Y2IXR6_ARAVE|nr:hypothetical protein AVEN_107737-1 [Araneus ventricosus]
MSVMNPIGILLSCLTVLGSNKRQGHGGFRAESRLRSWSVTGSRPEPIENPPCIRAGRSIGQGRNVRPLVWRGGCRPRHLTAVQNYEVRSNIALVLLQNGALI